MRAWLLPSAFALAALMFDPHVPAAVAKTPLLLAVSLSVAVFTRDRWRFSLGAACATLLLAWLGVSLLWSGHRAPLELAPWLGLAQGSVSLAGLRDDERRLAAGRFAMMVGLGSGASALVQTIGATPAHGGHGNPNWLGLALAVCFPFALEHATRSLARLEVWLARAALCLGGVGLLVSGSRSAWLGLSFALVFVGRGAARLLTLPLIGLLGYGLWRGDLQQAATGRLWIAKVSWQAALAALPFGSGLGGFPFAYLDAQGDLLAPLGPSVAARTFLNATTAHGDWMQLLVEGGPLALLVLSVFMIAGLTARSAAARATMMVALVAGGGDTVLTLPAVAIALSFSAADTPRLPARKSDPMSAVLMIVAASMLLPLAIRRFAAQRILHAALEQGDVRGRPSALERAVRIDGADGEVALAFGLALVEAGEHGRAIEALSHAKERLANVGTTVALGNTCLALERYGDAARHYREALALHPGSFGARLNLVEALRRADDLDAADSELAIARKLMPHHGKLARVAEQLRRDRVEASTRRQETGVERPVAPPLGEREELR